MSIDAARHPGLPRRLLRESPSRFPDEGGGPVAPAGAVEGPLGAGFERWPALTRQPAGTADEHAQGLLACAWELRTGLGALVGAREVWLGEVSEAELVETALRVVRAARGRRGAGRREVLCAGLAPEATERAARVLGLRARAAAPDETAGESGMQGPGLLLSEAAGSASAAPRSAPPRAARRNALAMVRHAGAPGARSAGVALAPAPYDLLCLDVAALLGLARDTGCALRALAARPALQSFLPAPLVAREGREYRWLWERDRVNSIGRVRAYRPSARSLLAAWAALRALGAEGVARVDPGAPR